MLGLFSRLLFQLVVFLAVSWAVNARSLIFSERAGMSVVVTCSVTGKADPGMEDLVCSELIDSLEAVYPGRGFVRVEASDTRPSLAVVVRNATAAGVGLKLIWTAADGRRVEGETLSVMAMDRTLTSAMRTSLYGRVIAATPMPD